MDHAIKSTGCTLGVTACPLLLNTDGGRAHEESDDPAEKLSMWLRVRDRDGRVLPSHEQEAQRAEQEAQRAEKAEAEVARLRALLEQQQQQQQE